MRIRNQQDFWSGVMFIITGLGFSVGALSYAFGNSARPGPGYFPFGLGLILAVLGAITLIGSLGGKDSQPDEEGRIGAWAWKPLGIIIGSMVLFGLLLPVLGMFIALPLLVFTTSMAGDEFHWGEAIVNAAILTVGSWAVFIWGLNLVIPLLPTFLAG
jgi:hypothetical protein